jgi:hypothetical protein
MPAGNRFTAGAGRCPNASFHAVTAKLSPLMVQADSIVAGSGRHAAGRLEPVIDRLERISNRIVLGVITAAFINGLAVLVSVYRPPGWERWAWAVFAFGFLCALLLGVYLAWSILKPKHS